MFEPRQRATDGERCRGIDGGDDPGSRWLHRPHLFTRWVLSASAASEAAATPEAAAATAARTIAAAAGSRGASGIARSLRTIDARAAIGIQLPQRATVGAALCGSISHAACGADRPLSVGPT